MIGVFRRHSGLSCVYICIYIMLNSFNLAMCLLQTRHHVLIELDLFGNEVLECLLQMRIPFALEVCQLGKDCIGDNICASANLLQLGIAHLVLRCRAFAIFALLYGAFVRGEYVRKAVQNTSAEGEEEALDGER